jgi:4-amino-4-deoxy-L-arabinose transferase-like glycosyltransferase
VKNNKLSQYILVFIIIFAAVFRLTHLSVSPPSLFGDELDLGYQAYSILKTGRDYQGNFLPLNFHSMAEWRTPLYLYTAVPSVLAFGVTPLGVRLPAAIFGILLVYFVFLLVKQALDLSQINKNYLWLPHITAALMAINPWALQYSRAGFEVTQMLGFLVLGLYFFLKSLNKNKYLWVSVTLFVLSMWVYSTAKLFVPMLLIGLLLIYRKEIISFSKRELVKAVLMAVVLGMPLVYGTFFAGGTQRISDISIFHTPNMEQQVGFARNADSLTSSKGNFSKLINNKYTFYGNIFITNYLKSFSSEFLFIKGDANLRQSIGRGLFYWFEILPLLAGIAFFFYEKSINKNFKLLILLWLLAAPVPAALTEGGGSHATRLITLMPVLLFIIACGIYALTEQAKGNFKKTVLIFTVAVYLIFFLSYLHRYYFSYRLESSKWWHYGWGEAISEIKEIDKDYDKVYISMSGEPAWIFFAGHYMYNPRSWQQEFPVGRDVTEPGFGSLSHTGKYYFGSPLASVQVYGLGEFLNSRKLYLANAKEHGENLSKFPEKIPPGLRLVKTVLDLGGEPLFYIFTGTDK